VKTQTTLMWLFVFFITNFLIEKRIIFKLAHANSYPLPTFLYCYNYSSKQRFFR